MTSRVHFLAGVAGMVLAFGIGSANATITDTYSLSQWLQANPGVAPLTPGAGSTSVPGTGVSFGTGMTPGSVVQPADAPGGSSMFPYWADSWSNVPGAPNINVIAIDGSSVTFNVSNLSAFGFFFEGSNQEANTFQITETGSGGEVINTESSVIENNSSGGTFFGYYGDITGAIQSITVTVPKNPMDDTYVGSIAVGQFYEVASPVPEPATLGLLGFGLASLGIIRRRKRG